MSHEIRTPLNALMGLAQLAHGDVLRSPFADARQRLEPGDRLFKGASLSKDRGVGQHSGGQRRERSGPGARHAQGGEVGPSQGRRAGKTWVRPSIAPAIPVGSGSP